MKISVIIITKDEQDDLPRCLKSIKWADEIIVVDSNSRDNTVTLARKSGARVFENQWKGYGSQKNFGIDKATNDWILSIDADEVVTSELQEEIRKIVQDPGDCVAFRMPRKLMFQGRFLRWGGSYPNYQIRLFLRGKAKYNLELVHEKLIIDGKVGSLKGNLIHYSYKDLSDYFERFNRYTTLDAQKRFNTGKRFYPWRYLYPAIKFIKVYFLQLGFLDGSAGLDWAILSSFCDFVKFQKLKEMYNEKK